MHFVVGKSSFLKELNLLQGVVEKKSTIPILSNLLLETGDGVVRIKGTDLDLSITTQCEADVKEAGALCIPAKKLFEIVRSLPDSEIEIKSGEKDQVTLVCERTRFKMTGVSKENFPEIREFPGAWAPIPSELVRIFIARTTFAITNEESRYALNGAKFEISDKHIRMVATDGHRLSFIEKRSDLGGGLSLDVLIPKKTLTELAKLCAETGEAVEFGYGENHLFFKVGARQMVSRTLSGQFPNYEMVLPKENHNSVVAECSRVASAVRRVALMADEKSHAIKFDIADGQIQITSQSADAGEAGDVLLVEYNGPAITAGFNAQYLLDFFGVIQDGQVTFEFKDGNSQAQLRAKDDLEYDFKYVVMPMRL
ncbi:MAG: DNA polymerase III subunit beta [Blastocatellia bacterium]|nr:DNA polymerase III subunit beta [Blastocatellia bacterium]